MAPVTATSAGIPRQTIDDPDLIGLLERLSKFDPTSSTSTTTTTTVDAGVVTGVAAANDNDDGDVEMADATADGAAAEQSTDGIIKTPPLDVDGLVAELECVPRWQFQEQADLYEWIRPLNAMDAALSYFMETHPSLLLLPLPKTHNMKKKKSNTSDEQADARENPNPNYIIPPKVIHAMTTILAFTSTLLHSSTNKHLYNSVPLLSSLLASSHDQIASLAISTLCSLATPPMLHRQQAPETNSHTTQLHRMGVGSEVMWRLLCLSRGWGGKGCGLGLLDCVRMDDSSDGMLTADSVDDDSADGRNGNEGVGSGDGGIGGGKSLGSLSKQELQFRKCAGEIVFECYCQPSESDDLSEDGKNRNGTLVSLYVSKEEMFEPSAKDAVSEGDEEQQTQAEKRRKIAGEKKTKTTNSNIATTPQLKSTSQLYKECLAKISLQLNNKDPTSVLPSSSLFTLLASIRLARSFHSSSTRLLSIERRLRALITVVHSHSSQECVSAYFVAQPELVGELVDLLRPSVSSGNISGGGLLENDEREGEEKKDGGGAGEENTVVSSPFGGRNNSILALSDSPLVPYAIRTLAIEALTALVARRDATGTLTNVARQTNVLQELGVGKGQYLGLLPTLIRYSLAALNSFLLHDGEVRQTKAASTKDGSGKKSGAEDGVRDLGLELGLAFLKATKPPPLPQKEREERALEFIDSVLTLTSAVISVPTGTASLTDCGIIPALVSTIALDGQIARRSLQLPSTGGDVSSSPFCTSGTNEESYSDCLLKFVVAQAIQILEGAIVTHNSALLAFHELKGVDMLIQRLSVEVERVKRQAESSPSEDAMESGNDVSAILMGATATKKPAKRSLRAARRVLLFSAVNCLTVVFHQHESSGTNPATPSGGAQLRKPELHDVLIEIMDHVESYGGVLAALVATFLSDVMNADPQVVHHVHKSGLAQSFLGLWMGKEEERKQLQSSGSGSMGLVMDPVLQPSGELIMALPNVITALSLTEAGAKAVADANPFPALMSIFCNPKYVMPNSRCLLNEMAAIIGTGLDELMRHNPSLKTLCLKAVVQVMNRIVYLGKNLISDEDGAAAAAVAENENDAPTPAPEDTKEDLETSRTYLTQYGYNITQFLEQILHSEDHIAPFLLVGGFDALLDLARWTTTPGGRSLVANVTCLSSPSVASAMHSSTSNTLSMLVKTVCSNTVDPSKLIKKIMAQLESQLFYHGNCVKAFTMDENRDALVCNAMLENVPPLPLYDLEESNENLQLLHSLSCLFRSLIHVDWLTNSLGTAIRAACQRGNELGGLGREREWKKEISSKSFESLVGRLSLLHRTSLYEVCRIRTEPDFDERDAVRSRAPDKRLVYKIRIVCQEGAIVRNGIDIDRCDSVGNLEQGEIVYANDRCINSSGVLRYRIGSGWVSELTRGHGRENITEILDVTVGTAGGLPPSAGAMVDAEAKSKRIECGVPDLRSVAASVLARLHGSQANLFSSLEKIMVSGVRLPQRSLAFQQNGVAPHVIAATKILSSNLKANFDFIRDEIDAEMGDDIDDKTDTGESSYAKDAATCMYFGNQINNLHSSLCEEKREEHRRVFNIPLLLNLLARDGWKDGIYAAADSAEEQNSESPAHDGGAVISAIRFVLMHSLRDMAVFAAKDRASGGEEQSSKSQEGEGVPYNAQRMSRAVAASLPPTLSLLRRLISRPLIYESQITSVLSKMKESDFASLINLPPSDSGDTSTLKFNAAQFTRALHLRLAKLSYEMWSDDRFSCAPSHVIHPFIQYLGDVIRNLEEAAKAIEPAPASTTERLSLTGLPGSRLRDLQDPNSRSGQILASMGLLRNPGAEISEPSVPFEPSEESISRLSEMGFSRDHAVEALENVATNMVEVAMEYALTHPPSSPATLARRRAARDREEQRILEQQRRNESLRQLGSSTNEEDPAPGDSSNTEGTQNQPSGSEPPIKNEEEVKPKTLTEDELKAKKEKEIEEKLAGEAKEYLEKTVKASLCKISLGIMEGSVSGIAAEENILGTKLDTGKGDSQGVIIVISNFLLDICRVCPALESNFVSELLNQLKAKLDVKSPSHCRVKAGCECSFAALLHASVVIFRALPKLRPLIIRHGNVIVAITHCVRNCTPGKDTSPSPMVWPRWLAPALLILEVMAQPTSVTLEDEGGDEVGKPANKKSEYAKLLSEHKKFHKKQASVMANVFSAVMNTDAGGKITPKKRKDPESKKQSDKKTTKDTPMGEEGRQKAIEEGKQKTKAQPTPPKLNAFLPLLHSETQEACMVLCLQLLGLKSKKGVDKVCPPPIIVNAVLVLLVRLLRSRKLAFLCLQMGGADLIIALPSHSYIMSNREVEASKESRRGVVSILLRRMLEDEVTLHSMMVGEIRSVVTRAHRKQHPSATAQQTMKVNLKSFMQACAPLICRDPSCFLKAIASSVKIGPPGSESSSLSSSRGSQVTLLNNEERARNAKLLSNHLAKADVSSEKPVSHEEHQPRRSSSRGRSKSPHRLSIGKGPKSTPTKSSQKNHCQLNGTPANHITSLLLKEIMRDSHSAEDAKQPFLSALDYLDILSDLVFSVAACGAAIHRYKLAKDVVVHNAVSTCPDPPQTAVSYILHKLLPQPRLAPKQELDSSLTTNSDKKLNLRAYDKTKMAQAAARLIVCLVARSGEGRRRVISDLVFALGCSQCPLEKRNSNSDPSSETEREDFDVNAEMWAISSWGDVVLGLSAPRSSSGNLTSQDANSTLSFGVVKLLLEAGAPHALMAAIERIELHHPMASSAASSVMRPLEIFTRASVFNTVSEMAEKDTKPETSKPGIVGNRRTTFGPSQRSESEIYDGALLEDEFSNNPARRHALDADDILDIMDDQNDENSHDEDDGESMEEDSDESSEIEVRLGNIDDLSMASDDSDGNSDEEISSDSESDGEDESDESESDGDEDDDDDDADAEELFSSEDEEGEEAEDWGVDNEDDFFDAAEEEANNGGPAAGNEVDDAMGMEGWTRVDAGGGPPRGLGNMLLDMVQPHAGRPGSIMDAAETMLGNILRGDMGGLEGLSEIEDTLGIRVVRGDGRSGGGLPMGGTNRAANPNAPARGGVPVHQNGNSTAIFGNRSLVELSPMEWVFGAPGTGAGSPGHESTPLANEDHHENTSLFPGGLQQATHPISRPLTHPMLQSVRLPPITSLVSTSSHGEGNNLQERNTRTIAASGNYMAGTNGAIIRVNDRFHSAEPTRRTGPSTLSGWLDDGLPPDRSSEDFSVSFGQALNSFLQDQAHSQNLLAQRNENSVQDTANPPDEDGAPPRGEGQGESSLESIAIRAAAALQDDEAADGAAEESEAPTENNADGAGQESQSEATEVRVSAMAAGLTISQPPSGNAPTDQSDQAGDQATNDAVMSDEGADAEVNPEEQESNSDAPDAPRDVDQQEESHEPNQGEAAPEPEEEDTAGEESGQLTCPPDIDPEVFNALPEEMQQEIVQQHQVAAQISESGLDPEALAALPEEMRREVIEQEQQQQRLREQQEQQPAADPANAEDMDNASFLASLAPDLRQEILVTADDTFLTSLPPTIQAEAHVLRERLASQQQRRAEETNATNAAGAGGARAGAVAGARPAQPPEGHTGASRARRQRNGKLRVESDRKNICWLPPGKVADLGPLLTMKSAKSILSLLYLLSPVQPRIVNKLILNLCLCEVPRDFILNALIGLLHNDRKYVLGSLKKLELEHHEHEPDDFSDSAWPPSALIGTASAGLVEDRNPRHIIDMFRRRQGGPNNSAVTVAASLPASARGGGSHNGSIPPVVARRIVQTFSSLCKTSPRVAFSMLCNAEGSNYASCFEKLLDLLGTNQYSQSSSNLEHLLGLLEIVVAPMSLLPKEEQEVDLATERASPGREWVKVPRQVVSKRRLHLLIHTLRLGSCKDSAFLKVSTLTRRLSRVEANRDCILDELALVAESLGRAAILDLKAVSVRLSSAMKKLERNDAEPMLVSSSSLDNDLVAGTPSSAVSLSTSNSELKLLRVLQMLSALVAQDDESKSEGSPPEFVTLLQSLKLESLWDELSVCLKTVGVLEGVTGIDVDESDDETENENNGDTAEGKNGKKPLQNSVAGLITRFLPAIEAFFMVNALPPAEETETASLVDNSRVVQFAASNKILLNALLRSNPQLLEKGLRAMVKMPKCRLFLDFDVKRQWFKTQVRRLRQQASRRHGSFRLALRRKHVFEDTFLAFIHRNADELRGRLHITFQNEEGVDAGGLSREFFAILAKEMFNPNYALFMSTEDGCTFQPNPNSSINPDDMRYFRFVGRIVGKAVVDGFLLDAHFTRSLYKHMLGVKPTHHDLQAIDPDYYKNLQMILEHNLEDIGLELTFSTEDHSFGRSRTIDLIPDGRTIPVTEESKARYVDLVCQHRITTAIERQIKAFLEGFHEMVDPDLISIFTAKELELLISGMPDIDISDLKKNTDFNGYRPADKEIGWFWNIMFSLSRSEKASFLQFVTGSSKVPLAGFGELQGMRGVQKFSINKASGPAGALMSAHTCFNALDLPVYNSEEQMKGKLLYAISEGGGGFGFA